MKRNIIIDASPLVALINRQDNFHQWTSDQVTQLAYPFLTCEAAITEACFLLRNTHAGKDLVMGLLNDGLLKIPFRLDEESPRIRELMTRYQSVPMSLADACLVRMSELIQGSTILTLDSDFRIYRKNGKESIEVIMPDQT